MVDRLFWRAGFGPTRAGPRDLDRQARQRGRRLAAVGPGGRRGITRHTRGQGARPDRRRHRPRAELGRPDGALDEPVRGAHGVLLAPPLRQLARLGVAAAAAAQAERPVPQVLRPRRQPERVVPRPRLRGHRRPVDAALPHRRVQREGRAERELRPRADGAVRARRARRERQADVQRERRAPARQGVLRLADQRLATRTTRRATSRRTAGTTARRSSSASSATTSRTRPSTSFWATPRTRPSWSSKLWSEFVAAPPGRRDAAVARLRLHRRAA